MHSFYKIIESLANVMFSKRPQRTEYAVFWVLHAEWSRHDTFPPDVRRARIMVESQSVSGTGLQGEWVSSGLRGSTVGIRGWLTHTHTVVNLNSAPSWQSVTLIALFTTGKTRGSHCFSSFTAFCLRVREHSDGWRGAAMSTEAGCGRWG